MNILKKFTGSSFLMLVLLTMLFLPIGAMGLTGIQQSDVLSQTSVRDDTNYGGQIPMPSQTQPKQLDWTKQHYPYPITQDNTVNETTQSLDQSDTTQLPNNN